jgi:aerobic-type carbon monoxide dehydrogenase small subunit (CoxS/CutS family)
MALLHRVAEMSRPAVRIFVNGEALEVMAGDTVLTALLTRSDHLRRTETGGRPRAGFCLMGACQDCWVALEQGGRIRACSTLVTEDLRLVVP